MRGSTVPSLLPAPEERAARIAEGVEGADHDEVADRARADGAAAEAAEEVIEGKKRAAALAVGDDRLAPLFAEVANVVEADAHGVLGLNREG